MKFTYTKKIIQRKGKVYTVIVPEDIAGFVNRYGLIFDSDRIGLNVIMLSALLLAKNKNIIVYYPLKGNQIPKLYKDVAQKRFDGDKLIYDAVFAHHALQMPIADWKAIRNCLKYAKSDKHIFEIDIASEYEICKKEYRNFERTDSYYQRKDVFNTYNRFETAFFIGGRFAFIDLFLSIKEMLELPLEENFKKWKWNKFDYIVLPNKELDCDFWCELGFYDIHLEERRYSTPS